MLNSVGTKKSIWGYITILQYFLLSNVINTLDKSSINISYESKSAVNGFSHIESATILAYSITTS